MFTVLLCINTAIIGQLMAAFVMPILALLFYLVDVAIRNRLFRRQFSIKYVMVLTAMVALVFGVAKAAGVDVIMIVGTFIGFLGVVLVYVVGAAPTVGFVTFCRATVASAFLMRQECGQSVFGGRSLARRRKAIAGFVGWIAALAASWKIAIDIMMIEYAKLPTTSPNCYVSSAAANGHPCLVGAFHLEAEELVVINPQMQRLKFLEFVLAASLPSLHQRIRRGYNRVGPSLARLCQTNQWFSDLTFVALKPLEWIALLLARWIGVSKSRIDRIYCR